MLTNVQVFIKQNVNKFTVYKAAIKLLSR